MHCSRLGRGKRPTSGRSSFSIAHLRLTFFRFSKYGNREGYKYTLIFPISYSLSMNRVHGSLEEASIVILLNQEGCLRCQRHSKPSCAHHENVKMKAKIKTHPLHHSSHARNATHPHLHRLTLSHTHNTHHRYCVTYCPGSRSDTAWCLTSMGPRRRIGWLLTAS